MNNIFQSHSYNVQLAKTYGVKSAVYLSYVGIREDRVGFKRYDMYCGTGLSNQEQCVVEQFLISQNLISIDIGEDDFIFVQTDTSKMKVLSDAAGVVIEGSGAIENNDVVKAAKKSTASSRKSITNEITLEELLNAIELNNSKKAVCDALGVSYPSLERLLDKYNIKFPSKQKKSREYKAYDSMIRSVDTGDKIVDQYVVDWISSVRDNPRTFMTKQSFNLSLNKLLGLYADQKDIIETLKIAIKNSYRDIDWAIDKYEKVRDSVSNNFVDYSSIKSDGSEMVGESF